VLHDPTPSQSQSSSHLNAEGVLQLRPSPSAPDPVSPLQTRYCPDTLCLQESPAFAKLLQLRSGAEYLHWHGGSPALICTTG